MVKIGTLLPDRDREGNRCKDAVVVEIVRTRRKRYGYLVWAKVRRQSGKIEEWTLDVS